VFATDQSNIMMLEVELFSGKSVMSVAYGYGSTDA
jgi:hypothetical protein